MQSVATTAVATSSGTRRRFSRKRLVWQLRRLLILYVGYMFSIFAFQRLMLFPRFLTQPEPDAGHSVPGLERIWLDTAEGRVEGWFLPGVGVSPQRPGSAVIFAHGNAELIEDWPLDLARYRNWGISVLLPEYRGYGRSAGLPSEPALTEDFIRFYDLLAARPDVDRSRIIFHGRSIGGGVVSALAARRPPAALILQSTFTRVPDLTRRFYLPRFLVIDAFDVRSVVSRLTCPMLIIHGRRDGTIPFAHGEALHAAAKGSRFLPYDRDHNDFVYDESFWEDVETFLREAGLIQR